MAIISKIRERAGLAVGLVAVSLGLFVVGSDLIGPGSSLFNSKPVVGEINGQDVTLEEFQNEIRLVEYDFTINNNKSPLESDMVSIREQAWNQIIFKKAFKPEFEKIGLVVSDDEFVDMVQGNNVHQAIKGSFVNQETNEFDKNIVINFLKNLDKAQPQQQAAWYNFERKLPDDRIRVKYENLLTKTNFTTTAEAKREYEVSNAKAEIKYLFVNYMNIPDSLVKVDDAMLKEHLKKNPGKFKSTDSRTVDYVQFIITPSKDDSAFFYQELADIKTQFATAEDDTAFAALKSDNAQVLTTVGVGELPEELKDMGTSLQTGQIYGPMLKGKTLVLYKVISIKPEGDFFARASHILFKASPGDEPGKKEAKEQATKILNEIKKGASFEEMARQYGSDGTASQGGDLGWFSTGRMVKPFEDAIFGTSTKGLLPNLVETDFGYHIVKITEPKTNIKYQVVSIERNITAGDETREQLYRQASEFRSKVNSAEAFDKLVKEAGIYNKLTASNLMKSSTYLNDIQDGRSIVQWSFNKDTKVGDISDVRELNDRYIVAVLTKKSDEDSPTVEDLREALTSDLQKDLKAKMIIEKLQKTGDLEEIAKNYGAGAVSNTVPSISLNSPSAPDIGYDPAAVGRAFGLKPGKRTAPFRAENGVAIIELTNFTPAPETQDYSAARATIDQKNSSRGQYYINEAVKEVLKVKDNRVQYY